MRVSMIAMLGNDKGIRAGLLLVCMLLLFVSASASWIGDGSASNPFKISTKEDLMMMRDSVNAGNRYAGKYFELTKGIDLGGELWDPIGIEEREIVNSCPFSGSFDGRHYSIRGLQVRTSHRGAGLFGFIYITADSGYIRNIGIWGDTVTSSCEEGAAIGSIVGKISIFAQDEGQHVFYAVQGCSNGGTVLISQVDDVSMGGIIGKVTVEVVEPFRNASFQMNNCRNMGVITSIGEKKGEIGGVVGSCISTAGFTGRTSRVVISKCTNSKTINVKGNACVGGVLGATYGYEQGIISIDECVNDGNVEVKGGGENRDAYVQAGGVVGFGGGWLDLSACNNSGIVKVSAATGVYAGGILGFMDADDEAVMRACTNKGDLEIVNSGEVRLGGLLGVRGRVRIESCRSKGHLREENNMVVDKGL